MLSSFLVLSLAALAPLVHANVFITNPVSSTSIPAGAAFSITWQDDGNAPTLATFGPCSIGLYAGNAQQQTLLQTIGSNVDVSKVNSQAWTPDATAGPNFNQYFIRFTSNSLKDANNSQFPAEAFSAKFTLTGMTGTFNSTVQQEISGTLTASSAAAATPATSKAITTQQAAVTTSGSTVKATTSATGSSTGSSSKSNGAGHMAVPCALGATGVAAIVFSFFL